MRNSLKTTVGYAGLLVAVAAGISTAGIDLSNLAIIAGALSVGIGFGLQNVVNNFVSGLILLVERPVKVGDWIVIGEHQGYVQRINVRATEIQTFQRSSVIIPNSELLSSALVNWTHKDAVARIDVPVGVSYHSDVERVRETLFEVAESHPEVVRRPEPVVLFTAFGDSALDFELRCFVAQADEVFRIATEIRFEIVRLFRERGIEIPFPQRDVHLRGVTCSLRGGRVAPMAEAAESRQEPDSCTDAAFAHPSSRQWCASPAEHHPEVVAGEGHAGKRAAMSFRKVSKSRSPSRRASTAAATGIVDVHRAVAQAGDPGAVRDLDAGERARDRAIADRRRHRGLPGVEIDEPRGVARGEERGELAPFERRRPAGASGPPAGVAQQRFELDAGGPAPGQEFERRLRGRIVDARSGAVRGAEGRGDAVGEVRGGRFGTRRRGGAKIAHALGVRVRRKRDALAAEQGAAVHLADEEVEALLARDAIVAAGTAQRCRDVVIAGAAQRRITRGRQHRRRDRRDAVPVAPAQRRRDTVAAGPAQRRPDRRRIPARMHVRGPRLAEILQAVTRGVPGDVAEVERLVVRGEVVVEEHAGGVVFEPVKLLFEDPPVGRPLGLGLGDGAHEAHRVLAVRFRVVERREPEAHHVAGEVAQMATGQGVEVQVGDPLGREMAREGRHQRIAHRRGNPRIHAMRDDVVELPEVRGEVEDVALPQLDVGERERGGESAPDPHRPRRQLDAKEARLREHAGHRDEVPPCPASEFQDRAPSTGAGAMPYIRALAAMRSGCECSQAPPG